MITSSPVKSVGQPTDEYQGDEVWCSEEHVQMWINNINEDEINGDHSSTKSSLDSDVFLTIPISDDDMEIGADARQYNLHNVSLKSPLISPLLPLEVAEETSATNCSVVSRDNRSDVSNSLRDVNTKILEACKAAQATNTENKDVNYESEYIIHQKIDSGSILSFGSSFDNPSSLAAVLQPDPEEILLSLGFGGGSDVSLLQTIPSRFFQEASTVCGIDVDGFHRSLLINQDVNSFCNNVQSLPHRFSCSTHSSESLCSLNAENRRILFKSCHRDIPSIHLSFDVDCPPSPTSVSTDSVSKNRLATLTELPEPSSRGSSFEEELSNEVAAAFTNALKSELKNIAQEDNVVDRNLLNITDTKELLFQEQYPMNNHISDMYANLVIPSVMKRSDSDKSLCSSMTIVDKEELNPEDCLPFNSAVFKPITDDEMDVSPIQDVASVAFEIPHVIDDKSANSKRTLFRKDSKNLYSKFQYQHTLVNDELVCYEEVDGEAACTSESILEHSRSNNLKTPGNTHNTTIEHTIEVEPSNRWSNSTNDHICGPCNELMKSDGSFIENNGHLSVDADLTSEVCSEEICIQNSKENVGLITFIYDEQEMVSEFNNLNSEENNEDSRNNLELISLKEEEKVICHPLQTSVEFIKLDDERWKSINNIEEDSLSDTTNHIKDQVSGQENTSPRESEEKSCEDKTVDMPKSNSIASDVFSVEIRRRGSEGKTSKISNVDNELINETIAGGNDNSNTLRLIEEIKEILSKPLHCKPNINNIIDNEFPEDIYNEIQIINDIKEILSKPLHCTTKTNEIIETSDVGQPISDLKRNVAVENEVVGEGVCCEYPSNPTEIISDTFNFKQTALANEGVKHRNGEVTCNGFHETELKTSKRISVKIEETTYGVLNNIKGNSFEANVVANIVNGESTHGCVYSDLNLFDISNEHKGGSTFGEGTYSNVGEVNSNEDSSFTDNVKEEKIQKGITGRDEITKVVNDEPDEANFNTNSMNDIGNGTSINARLQDSNVDDIFEKQDDLVMELGEVRFEVSNEQKLEEGEDRLSSMLAGNVSQTKNEKNCVNNEFTPDLVDTNSISDLERSRRFNESFKKFCTKLQLDFMKESEVSTVEINEDICEKPMNKNPEPDSLKDIFLTLEDDLVSEQSNKDDTEIKRSAKSYLSAAFHSIAMALGKYQDSKQSKCADDIIRSENDINNETEKRKEVQREKRNKRKKLFNIFNHRTATLQTDNTFPLLAANLIEGKTKIDTPEKERNIISTNQREVNCSQIQDVSLNNNNNNIENIVSPTQSRKYPIQQTKLSSQSSIDKLPQTLPDTSHGYIPDSPLSSDDQPCSSTRNKRKRFNIKQFTKGISMESSGFDEHPPKQKFVSDWYCNNCNNPYVPTHLSADVDETRFAKELDKLMSDTKSHFEQNCKKCECGRTNYYGFITHSHFEYVIKQLTRVRSEINTHFDLQAKRESDLKLLLNNQVNEMKQIMTTEYMGWILREMDSLKNKLKEKDDEIEKLRGEQH